MWGSGFEELELREWSDQLARIGEVQLVTGERDLIVRREVIDQTARSIEAFGGNVKILTHPGGHELDQELLVEIGRLTQEG
jgi:predicted esterase